MSKNETENSKTRNEIPENFPQAVDALRRGQVIVFPTETLYGLGADALKSEAVEKVFQLKGRDPKNPIPVLIADEKMLLTLVAEVSQAAKKLMQRFWPGPLTLVLPAQKGIPLPLLNRKGGVGVRITSQPLAVQLMQALGRPLTATSANPSGREPARTIQEAQLYFADQVKIFVDGGVLTSKTGSTVVEVIGDSLNVIREGEISVSELMK